MGTLRLRRYGILAIDLHCTMIIDTLVTNARASCMFVNVENDLPVFRISEGKPMTQGQTLPATFYK